MGLTALPVAYGVFLVAYASETGLLADRKTADGHLWFGYATTLYWSASQVLLAPAIYAASSSGFRTLLATNPWGARRLSFAVAFAFAIALLMTGWRVVGEIARHTQRGEHWPVPYCQWNDAFAACQPDGVAPAAQDTLMALSYANITVAAFLCYAFVLLAPFAAHRFHADAANNAFATDVRLKALPAVDSMAASHWLMALAFMTHVFFIRTAKVEMYLRASGETLECESLSEFFKCARPYLSEMSRGLLVDLLQVSVAVCLVLWVHAYRDALRASRAMQNPMRSPDAIGRLTVEGL